MKTIVSFVCLSLLALFLGPVEASALP